MFVIGRSVCNGFYLLQKRFHVLLRSDHLIGGRQVSKGSKAEHGGKVLARLQEIHYDRLVLLVLWVSALVVRNIHAKSQAGIFSEVVNGGAVRRIGSQSIDTLRRRFVARNVVVRHTVELCFGCGYLSHIIRHVAAKSE